MTLVVVGFRGCCCSCNAGDDGGGKAYDTGCVAAGSEVEGGGKLLCKSGIHGLISWCSSASSVSSVLVSSAARAAVSASSTGEVFVDCG